MAAGLHWHSRTLRMCAALGPTAAMHSIMLLGPGQIPGQSHTSVCTVELQLPFARLPDPQCDCKLRMRA